MLEIIFYILIWGLVVKFIILSEPDTTASIFTKLIWVFFWILTLSFFFSSSSANSTSETMLGDGYDECDYRDNDSCEDDFWDSDGD